MYVETNSWYIKIQIYPVMYLNDKKIYILYIFSMQLAYVLKSDVMLSSGSPPNIWQTERGSTRKSVKVQLLFYSADSLKPNMLIGIEDDLIKVVQFL